MDSATVPRTDPDRLDQETPARAEFERLVQLVVPAVAMVEPH
jgi:hypothetical protein